MPLSDAAMLTESDLNNSDDDKYKHQRPKVMKDLYGDPAIEINFDEITDEDCATDGKHINGNTLPGPYYQWPREWENSSYGFGYENRFDYNMYVVANHSDAVPYKDAVPSGGQYDRLYYDSQTKKKGFFYYVNAASDPGRMAVLNIGKEMCTNTRIYVSAWVCEMNNNYEAANLVFSFKGIKSDGSETVLSSYVTGYVLGGTNTKEGFKKSKTSSPDNRGEWMHVYYSFLPNALSSDFDHYVISLENNCTSSQGADYAIDDIECYVRKLAIYAKQDQPVCNHTKDTKLRMSVDFGHLMEAFLIPEAASASEGKTKTLYYCFLEKSVYEGSLETDGDYRTAFNKALVHDTYDTKHSPLTYGTFTFNTHFASNGDMCKTVGANRSLEFPAEVSDQQMRINGRYLVAMIDAAKYEAGYVPDAVDFAVEEPCSNVSEFGVTFSGEVKIDGLLDSEQAGAELCLNQKSPPITIDLNGINKLDESVYHKSSPDFDWFLGTVSDYEGAVYNDVPLVNSLFEFRTKYPSASFDDCRTKPISGTYTQAMKDCILHFAEEGKLLMLQNTGYVSLKEHYQDPLNPGEQMTYSITAIPINPEPDNKNLNFCLDPIQINTYRSANTPHMLDGDDHGVIAYPIAMEDVPLRIGLTQLRRCSNLTTTKNESITTPAGELLYVPLRNIRTATTGVTQLKKSDSDDYVYLASSNDPLANTESSGAIAPSGGGLKYIGRVESIRATTADHENVCKMAFLKDFKFREGYYYTVKFNFEEDNKNAADSKVCPGDVLLTIKVVPEYQMWTGAVSRNWNDDRNWRRVTREELFNPGASVVGNDYVSDGGTNDNLQSFVPADFTKVIIPAGGTVPYMYNLRDAGNLKEVTFAGYGTEAGYITSMATGNDEILAVPYETYHDETEDVDEYAGISEDMASVDVTDGVACRPWYDHTCEQIHFMSGSELMDQRYLYYRKAWVDLEMEPGRWHTMASPLVSVVAGDFYLPTDGARQNTPLFQDITYDTELNDRFKPAVYQRSWNASDTKVVRVDGTTENTAVKLDWSYVYNDVNVNYDAGIGFSVKPDVSRLPESKRPEKVKFRFPKADVSYTYYNPGNTDGGNAEDVIPEALVDGQRVGRLVDISSAYGRSVSSDEGSYFLVGNPFMCHLRMDKFFAGNPNLKKRYWMVTASGQNVAVMDESTDGFISTITDATLVAPGVSFFVELTEGTARSFQPNFTSDMMTYVENADEPDPTVSASGLLRVSVTAESGFESALLLADATFRNIEGAEALFDSNLSDEPMVYATIDRSAVSIAGISEGSRIPVGVSGISGVSELRITGADSFVTPLSVYDAVLGTTQPLNRDMVLPLNGSGVRYYIVSGSDSDMDASAAVAISVDGTRLLIDASADCQIDHVLITDSAGRVVAVADNAGPQYIISLSTGTYVVSVKSGTSEYSSKVCL